MNVIAKAHIEQIQENITRLGCLLQQCGSDPARHSAELLKLCAKTKDEADMALAAIT